MYLVIGDADLSRLKPETIADLLNLRSLIVHPDDNSTAHTDEEDEAEDVVSLTPSQVAEFMEGISPETRDGLRVFAEHGPKIRATLLADVGINSYSHFQMRVTKRTRTILRDRSKFLFNWDDWDSFDNGVGHYWVTMKTWRSLRTFFGLD